MVNWVVKVVICCYCLGWVWMSWVWVVCVFWWWKVSFVNWIVRCVGNWCVRYVNVVVCRKLKCYLLFLCWKKMFVYCWCWRIFLLIRILVIKSRWFSFCVVILVLMGVLNICLSWKKMFGSGKRLLLLVLVLV